jgi:hypothetical protein
MRKSLVAIPLLALLAACSGGGGSTMSPLSPQRGGTQSGAHRHTMSITTINYTLGSASYPSGYNPTCGSSLNTYVIFDSGAVVTNFSFGGGQAWTVYVGPCHAAAGDSMTASLTDDYGHITFPTHPSPGNPTIDDTGNDSHAVLTITDNTTGASVTKDVWYSY